MKPIITILTCLLCVQLFACCNKHNEMTSGPGNVLNTDSMRLKITIGSNTFTAILYNNPTVTAFKEILPLTIDMSELNGNEKYADLLNNLPANASNPRTIHSGDLMLYGPKTLVLFYKAFSTSYSYTSIGRIDNPEGLAAAVGPGNITVKFELVPNNDPDRN